MASFHLSFPCRHPFCDQHNATAIGRGRSKSCAASEPTSNTRQDKSAIGPRCIASVAEAEATRPRDWTGMDCAAEIFRVLCGCIHNRDRRRTAMCVGRVSAPPRATCRLDADDAEGPDSAAPARGRARYLLCGYCTRHDPALSRISSARDDGHLANGRFGRGANCTRTWHPHRWIPAPRNAADRWHASCSTANPFRPWTESPHALHPMPDRIEKPARLRARGHGLIQHDAPKLVLVSGVPFAQRAASEPASAGSRGACR